MVVDEVKILAIVEQNYSYSITCSINGFCPRMNHTYKREGCGRTWNSSKLSCVVMLKIAGATYSSAINSSASLDSMGVKLADQMLVNIPDWLFFRDRWDIVKPCMRMGVSVHAWKEVFNIHEIGKASTSNSAYSLKIQLEIPSGHGTLAGFKLQSLS